MVRMAARAEGVSAIPRAKWSTRSSAASEPNGRLGQWMPTIRGWKSGRTARMASRSARHEAMASTHRVNWARAAGRSPIHPWHIKNTSVAGRASSSARAVALPKVPPP